MGSVMGRSVWLGLSMMLILSYSAISCAEDPPAAVPPMPEPAAQPADAAAPAEPVSIPDLSGRWRGYWISCVNNHTGPMNANFCLRCDGHYDVTFNGRFWKLIPFHYKTTLTVTGYENGKVHMSGSHFLGPILGSFSYNAWSDGCQFISAYCARKDNGQFVMNR